MTKSNTYMTKIDYPKLKSNIISLMENEKMTQAELADILGMSQSNVSKCLKMDDNSRSFTLEQICAIADHFGKSVDDLLGRNNTQRSISERDVCAFLVSLLENDMINPVEIEKEETIFYPENPYMSTKSSEVKTIKYNAFYFPNYYLPDDDDDDDPQVGAEQFAEIQACGNDLPKQVRINQFLQRYLNAFNSLRTGLSSKEDYDILVEAYFKVLE